MNTYNELAALNRTLEQAHKEADQLLSLMRESKKSFSQLEDVKREIQEPQNDSAVEKSLLGLEQLRVEMEKISEFISDISEDNDDREQWQDLRKNISQLQELRDQIQELHEQFGPVAQDLQRQYQNLYTEYQDLQQKSQDFYYQKCLAFSLAGDSTISPSLISIFRQSSQELRENGHILWIWRFQSKSILSPEIKHNIWEHLVRLSKVLILANKGLGIDINDFPIENFYKKLLAEHHRELRYFFYVPHSSLKYYVGEFLEAEEFNKFRSFHWEKQKTNNQALIAYLILELYMRTTSVWFEKEYPPLSFDPEYPALENLDDVVWKGIDDSVRPSVESLLLLLEKR